MYKLITKNSIDETMVKIQVTKLELDVELSDTNKGKSSYNFTLELNNLIFQNMLHSESHNQRINVIQMFKDMLN